MQVGDKIRKLREAKGVSQKEVSLTVGIERAQYSRIETGKAEPMLSSLEKIAAALGVTMAYFFTEEQPRDIHSYDQSLVERVRMIDELDEKEMNSILTIIDMAIAKKRLKDTLANALNLTQ
jgi:transcriptional regulator with XRE-family HTH domain